MLLYDIILFLPFLNGSHWVGKKWRIGKKLKWNNTTIKMKKKRKKPTINVRVRWSEVLLLSMDYLSDVRIFKLWGKKYTFVFNNWTFNLGHDESKTLARNHQFFDTKLRFYWFYNDLT